MRTLAVIVLVAFALNSFAEEKETAVESRIVSVGLFKNGLAVVKRTLSVPGAGTYVLRDAPEPAHGTFWIESDAVVETLATSRETEVPATGANIQEELAGKRVTIHFRDGQVPPATGNVLPPEKPKRAWDRTYDRSGESSWRSSYQSANPAAQPRYLVLKTDAGRIYVDPSMIAFAQVEGEPAKVTARKPALVFNVGEVREKPATITITYLTKGIGWAPSYHVDITDPQQLSIEQRADVRNELDDLADAEVFLISGFPSVQFWHVSSLMSAASTWSSFFQQLSSQPGGQSNMMRNITQQRIISNSGEAGQGIDLSAIPLGEGPDLHYQPIGRRTLNAGDSLGLSVASGKTAYERIVEWIVPDTRDAYGRQLRDNDRDRNRDEDDAWDALRFRNPLRFPMTTAPATIVSGGRFMGQRASFYVNAGEETTLRVTKALSVRTRNVENEEQAKQRDIVWIGGSDFRRVEVKGEVTVSNHRAEVIKLVIRRRFSGELLEAEGDAKVLLLEEGVYSVNKRSELAWSTELGAGNETTFAYRYSVLVRN